MKVLLFLPCFLLSLCGATLVNAAYPPGFNNFTGCIYTYLLDERSEYIVTFPEPTETQKGTLKGLNYDASKSNCIDGTSTPTKPGLLTMDFTLNDNYFQSMSLEMHFNNVGKEFWEVTKATLKILPSNSQPFPSTTIDLRSVSGDVYAGQEQSYSCSSLVLVNLLPSGPQFRLTLRRFQLQPFHEPAKTVFAPSRDCSTWLTMPQIMGFILVLFMIFTVLIGVYLLLELGGHSSDLRYSKQGGMLMNQAQLDATKAD